jgi:hypothetical protein
MLLAVAGFAMADSYTVTTNPEQVKAGEDFTMTISLDNEGDVCAWQFKIYLPESITWVGADEDDPASELSDRHSAAQRNYEKNFSVLPIEGVAGGYFAYTYASKSSNILTGNSGEIVTITLHAAATMADGDVIAFKECETTNPSGTGSKIADFDFIINDQVGIENMIPNMHKQAKNSAIFNVLGQRVYNMVKGGLYVVNGKKYIWK